MKINLFQILSSNRICPNGHLITLKTKMENLFIDDAKIKIFKQIQNDLLDLESNSKEQVIDDLIKKIPQNYLENKEDLMTICQLFSYYGRNHAHKNKGNVIKLFEKIMIPIKTHLHDESTFFWNIFGGLCYFKLWFYEEGFISIEKIINSIRQSNSIRTIEYFLPEIIEKVPDIFDKEIKERFEPKKYSKEYIDYFKKLRKKHFNWLRNSNDFHNPIYREIEKDPLRYSIKTDDVDSFQSIISNTNMNINSKIDESIIENFDRRELKISLFQFSIEYQAIKIFKYLIMNDVIISKNDVYTSIYQRNYEMMHIIESKNPEFFNRALISAVTCWNVEITEYSINNYSKDYIKNDKFIEIDENNESSLRDMKNIIFNTFFSCNFIFFDDYLLPFLKSNESYVKNHIYSILVDSLKNDSCFFLKEFLKYPSIDINLSSAEFNNRTLLIK